ncbi:MAG: hypothetical protein AABZ55_00285, partial [Bdellovibrionota bacterium]
VRADTDKLITTDVFKKIIQAARPGIAEHLLKYSKSGEILVASQNAAELRVKEFGEKLHEAAKNAGIELTASEMSALSLDRGQIISPDALSPANRESTLRIFNQLVGNEKQHRYLENTFIHHPNLEVRKRSGLFADVLGEIKKNKINSPRQLNAKSILDAIFESKKVSPIDLLKLVQSSSDLGYFHHLKAILKQGHPEQLKAIKELARTISIPSPDGDTSIRTAAIGVLGELDTRYPFVDQALLQVANSGETHLRELATMELVKNKPYGSEVAQLLEKEKSRLVEEILESGDYLVKKDLRHYLNHLGPLQDEQIFKLITGLEKVKEREHIYPCLLDQAKMGHLNQENILIALVRSGLKPLGIDFLNWINHIIAATSPKRNSLWVTEELLKGLKSNDSKVVTAAAELSGTLQPTDSRIGFALVDAMKNATPELAHTLSFVLEKSQAKKPEVQRAIVNLARQQGAETPGLTDAKKLIARMKDLGSIFNTTIPPGRCIK